MQMPEIGLKPQFTYWSMLQCGCGVKDLIPAASVFCYWYCFSVFCTGPYEQWI